MNINSTHPRFRQSWRPNTKCWLWSVSDAPSRPRPRCGPDGNDPGL